MSNDENVTRLTPKAFDDFVAAIDAPPEPNEKLKDLMRRPAPWELVAVKRSWVPEWLWDFACADLWVLPRGIACYQPFRWLLTKPS